MNIEARIPAIETTYMGYRFRSRLEARWAVLFDAIGWSWEYEPEGFDFGHGIRYLPDFRLQTEDGPLWIEVKPVEPSLDECMKAGALVLTLKQPIVFCIGVPHPEQISGGMKMHYWDGSDVATTEIGIGSYARRKWGRAALAYRAEHLQYEDVSACARARSARFERGEWGFVE